MRQCTLKETDIFGEIERVFHAGAHHVGVEDRIDLNANFCEVELVSNAVHWKLEEFHEQIHNLTWNNVIYCIYGPIIFKKDNLKAFIN